MRRAEVDYWDKMAKERIFTDGGILDNPIKRVPMVRAMLAYPWAGTKVLEIGIGAGLTAGALKFLTAGTMKYLGTDLSPAFVANAPRFGLKAVQADVTKLPGENGEYDRVIALDSLEHVRPEDREAGYAEISRVMAPRGLLFINIPLSESHHVDEFDHGFGLDDLVRIADAGLSLEKYDTYETIYLGDVSKRRKYAMAVMQK